MKYGFLILLLLIPILISAQDPAVETIFENAPENEQENIDDDHYLQQLDFYRRRPLNLNTATELEIAALNILHELQLKNFISYRRLMGNFISIYELQAIPGWNLDVISRIRPFVTVAEKTAVFPTFWNDYKATKLRPKFQLPVRSCSTNSRTVGMKPLA